MTPANFIKLSDAMFIKESFVEAFQNKNLITIEDIFAFDSGEKLSKKGLSQYRTRIKFTLQQPPVTVYLKRYEKPPILVQLRTWLHRRCRISSSQAELEAMEELRNAGIDVPNVIAYGSQRAGLFEKRSFIITEELADAESLERRLPEPFHAEPTLVNLRSRRDFICKLAEFINKFHRTGYRHRDLYFSHIFFNKNSRLYLIDLARAFKPLLLSERFRVKDIAQLNYSALPKLFSNTDRIRFYKIYSGTGKLSQADKKFIRKVLRKNRLMARHDKRQGRPVPFANI